MTSESEIAVYKHIVRYLMFRVRVMYAGPFEQCPIDHYGGLFVIHAQR